MFVAMSVSTRVYVCLSVESLDVESLFLSVGTSSGDIRV